MPKHFECRVCRQSFQDYNSFRVHKLANHPAPLEIGDSNSIKKSCPLCETTYNRRDQLFKHHQRHHTVEVGNRVLHQCPDCPVKFSRKKEMLDHWQEIHAAKEVLGYRCYLCLGKNKVYLPTQEALEKHTEEQHLSQADRQDNFGFQETASAFQGLVSTYLHPLQEYSIQERQSIDILERDETLMTNLKQLIQSQIVKTKGGVFNIVLKATYIKYDEQGDIEQRLQGVVLRASNFRIIPQRLPFLDQIIAQRFVQLRQRSIEFEDLSGSNWVLESIDAMIVEFNVST